MLKANVHPDQWKISFCWTWTGVHALASWGLSTGKENYCTLIVAMMIKLLVAYQKKKKKRLNC